LAGIISLIYNKIINMIVAANERSALQSDIVDGKHDLKKSEQRNVRKRAE
jgi:hypothetical protein